MTPGARFVWWIRHTPLGVTITRAELLQDDPAHGEAVLKLRGCRPRVKYSELGSTAARALAKAGPGLEAVEEAEKYGVNGYGEPICVTGQIVATD
jgi:hypothetical protein